MLKSVWPTEQDKQDTTYALWLRKSAYLHGDPLNRMEVLDETLENDQVSYRPRFETSISQVGMLKVATGHVLELMYHTYLVTDRQYGLLVHGRKALTLFRGLIPDDAQRARFVKSRTLSLALPAPRKQYALS